MSYVIELSDEQYETLQRAAEERGETLANLLTTLAEEVRSRKSPAHAYTTEEWFRHLGATDEQIAEARRIARERSNAPG
jgi:cobalamin biosynthesis protein CbiD